MKKANIWTSAAIAGLFTLGLAGCSADGTLDFDSGTGGLNDNGNEVSDDPNDGFLNDGSVGGVISVDGTAIEGTFRCTASAQALAGATTEVTANGLLGGPLSLLLNLLGGNTLTALTNSVQDKNDAIDGSLVSHSTFVLTVDLLNLLDSVDQSVLLPTDRNAGDFAAFAVAFPAGTVNLALLNQIRVTTFLNGNEQETSLPLTQNALDLLGQNLVGDVFAFVGLQATQPYDRATLSFEPAVLNADVGEAMFVYEMCTDVQVIPPPIAP